MGAAIGARGKLKMFRQMAEALETRPAVLFMGDRFEEESTAQSRSGREETEINRSD